MSAKPYTETILVVDDTEFMVQVLEDVFTAEGYRVVTAKNGQEALAAYEQTLPDLMTLDMVMPGMDGLQVLEALREVDPAFRVIVVSAFGMENRVVDAIKMGARNYLLKPFDKDKVLETARRVLDEY